MKDKDEEELARKYDLKSPTAFLNRSDYSGNSKQTSNSKNLVKEYNNMIEKLNSNRGGGGRSSSRETK